MSFFGNLRDAMSRPRIKDPVPGTAQVISVSMPPHQSGGGGMCEMNLVVSAPGANAVSVRKASLVPLAKWPMPGMQLPVVVERGDPGKFLIQWDRVPTARERGAEQARLVADQMSNPENADATVVRTNVTINGRLASAEDLAPFEAMTGMDLNGDGVVGGATGQSDTPAGKVVSVSGAEAADLIGSFLAARSEPADGEDTVSALERLAALRAAGALTDEEFAAAKEQVLRGQ